MNFTGESKFFIGIIVATLVLVIGGVAFLSRPETTIPRAELVKGTNVKGATDSKVYLVEFSDFQCPACKAAKPFVDEVLKKYGDKIVFVYRHFPLDQHPFGQKAAETAEIAASQGKFWEMYDLLFANQERFSDEVFVELANKVGIPGETFKKDLENHTYTKKVNEDQAAGTRFGVNSTPTFFLNGKKLVLTSLTDLQTEVEKALR